MSNPSSPLMSERRTVTVELPMAPHLRIVHPEQVILKFGGNYHDIGSYCFAIRSDKPRRPGQPRAVAQTSFLKQRGKIIIQATKYLNNLHADLGMSVFTIRTLANWFRQFMDWADTHRFFHCLAGGAETTSAYVKFCDELREKYKTHLIGTRQYNDGVGFLGAFLEAITGTDGLGKLIRRISGRRSVDNPTEPATQNDFSHALALNQSVFDGLCDLVLDGKPFPFKLELPKTLGWHDCYLWVFPLRMWRLPPHLWGNDREKLNVSHWAYDYEHGQLASAEELSKRYKSNRKLYTSMFLRHAALRALKLAQQFLSKSNEDLRHWARIMLGMNALNAFLFLFLANTGCNEAAAREIETDGEIKIGTLSQNFRSIKFRAQGKLISLTTPAAFLPTLRRFMSLRRWLLRNTEFPHLFFTLGSHNAGPPSQIGEGATNKAYKVLRGIDPNLPSWNARKIRATVADYYQRRYDASVTAKVLQNSPDTVVQSYDAGSSVDHHAEMSVFLDKVAAASVKRKRPARPPVQRA